MTVLTEATVEDAAFTYLENIGWTIAHGPESPIALLPKLVSREVRVVESVGREGLYNYS